MSRSVPEWIGASHDTPVPDRVRVRVFEAKGGRCHRCERKITAGERWTCEHMTALINGGENRERNLDVTCSWCLPLKNAEDLAIKSKTYRVKKKHVGIHKRSSFACSKASPWKKKISGEVVRRTNVGALSPEHPSWVMGLPPEWMTCAPSETPLFPKWEPNLSPRRSEQSSTLSGMSVNTVDVAL